MNFLKLLEAIAEKFLYFSKFLKKGTNFIKKNRKEAEGDGYL